MTLVAVIGQEIKQSSHRGALETNCSLVTSCLSQIQCWPKSVSSG